VILQPKSSSLRTSGSKAVTSNEDHAATSVVMGIYLGPLDAKTVREGRWKESQLHSESVLLIRKSNYSGVPGGRDPRRLA
jgi:hypothetical protein